jgi:ABC-type bacteriocin/lantibiotic exporter with double-glycine peptidase domain
VLAALAVLGGCISYSGGARSLDPVQLRQPGWIVAAPTPELRQQGSRDCGAAALAMIAGRWHVELSVQAAVAALPAPTKRGTKLGDLRDVARAHGLSAFAIAGDRDTLVHELRAGRPVIVGLLLPYGSRRVQSHYEVIVGVHPASDQFVTINPANGWRTRSWAALDAEWQPAGRPTLVVVGNAAATTASISQHRL